MQSTCAHVHVYFNEKDWGKRIKKNLQASWTKGIYEAARASITAAICLRDIVPMATPGLIKNIYIYMEVFH